MSKYSKRNLNSEQKHESGLEDIISTQSTNNGVGRGIVRPLLTAGLLLAGTFGGLYVAETSTHYLLETIGFCGAISSFMALFIYLNKDAPASEPHYRHNYP